MQIDAGPHFAARADLDCGGTDVFWGLPMQFQFRTAVAHLIIMLHGNETN